MATEQGKCPKCGNESLYRDDFVGVLQCDSCHWSEREEARSDGDG